MTIIKHLHTPKQILASLRSGNYAHPGEEEAIELTMHFINKIPTQRLLDVGCGLGGSAHYIQQHGWGTPIGIDIDANSIEFAQSTYQQLKFYTMNVVDVAQHFAAEYFDVIYLINSFYAFTNQLAALQQLRKVATQHTQLVLFDYMSYKDNAEQLLPFAPKESIYARKNFTPIKKESIKAMLEQSGWQINRFIDLGAKYQQWYSELMTKCYAQKESLIAKFNLELYTWLETSYSNLLTLIKQGKLSGCLIIADAII